MNEIISIDHSIELRGFILICELERMYGKKFDMIETNKIKLFSDEFFPVDVEIGKFQDQGQCSVGPGPGQCPC